MQGRHLILSVIKTELGDLDCVKQFVQIIGFVRCTDNCTNYTQAIDGASELFYDLYGEAGLAATHYYILLTCSCIKAQKSGKSDVKTGFTRLSIPLKRICQSRLRKLRFHFSFLIELTNHDCSCNISGYICCCDQCVKNYINTCNKSNNRTWHSKHIT